MTANINRSVRGEALITLANALTGVKDLQAVERYGVDLLETFARSIERFFNDK